MKIKKVISLILILFLIIEMLSPIIPRGVFASENADIDGQTQVANEEQTGEEVSREYEIKEEETWDISENGDGSVIAKWTLSDKTLRISGNGKMKNWGDNYEKEDWHNSQYTNIIEKVIIEENVIKIGQRAFYRCYNLSSIEIPDSIIEIGNGAFSGCRSLADIEIPKRITKIGDSTFSGCSSLTNINLSENITFIDFEAFSGCINLTNVTIPKSVGNLRYNAFGGCSSLENINVDENNKNYMSENGILFNKEKTEIIKFPEAKKDIINYEIPETVTSIGSEAFSGVSNLESVKIPNSVINIGESAFENCSKLENINIPENVTKIETYTFFGCSNLKSIEIPKNITSIGIGGFSECNNLQKIILPTSLVSIETVAFKNCISLKEIDIPNGVTKIDNSAFDGCNNLIKMEFPEYIRQMGFVSFENKIVIVIADSDAHKYVENKKIAYALEGEAKNITTEYELKKEELWDISENGDMSVVAKWDLNDKTLTISGRGNMKNWNNNALNDVWKEKYTNYIEKVVIEEGITNIGRFALIYCSSLTSIEIPESVTNIESSAFLGCSALTNIDIPENVTEIKSYTFSDYKI